MSIVTQMYCSLVYVSHTDVLLISLYHSQPDVLPISLCHSHPDVLLISLCQSPRCTAHQFMS